MKYDVGDEVILKTGDKLRIDGVEYSKSYYWVEQINETGGYDSVIFTDKDIDHPATKKHNAYGGYQIPREAIADVPNRKDDVIKPNHYKKNGKDLIDTWKDLFCEQSFRDIMKSNILRYLIRYENKNGIEDLKKADEFRRRLEEWEEEIAK